MYQRAETSSGGGSSSVKNGSFGITSAGETHRIDTGLGRKPKYIWIIGKSINYPAATGITTASLWCEEMNANKFRWVANATTNSLQDFTTTTTDVNKIQAVNNDGTVDFKASGTAQTAVGTYYWYAE